MPVKKCLLLLIYFIFIIFSKLHAQLCNGSLGDPIVNITFGAGPNPGGAVSTTANLIYFSNECPNDGYYTIRNNTGSCFGNTWHTLTADHTGDPNGYFMLINASLQKSEFYIDTVRGLCPNTTYEFAAWVINVLLPSACSGNGINPNLTFNIEKMDGTVLQTYSTGDIFTSSNPQWKQHGFFFVTPENASQVILRIVNNSSGGCGNDLAIDDITFRPCGSRLTSYIVGEPGTTKNLCVGDNTNVTLSCHVSAGYNNPSYQWQESLDMGVTYKDIPGAVDTFFVKSIPANTPKSNFLYRLSVAESSNISVASCKIASKPLTININAKPTVDVKSNSPVCEGASLVLSASGGAEYIWTGGNELSASGSTVNVNTAKLRDSGVYYVNIKSADGCAQRDSTIVSVIPSPKAEINVADKTVCEGDSVLLNSSGGASYSWSPSAGLSSAVIPNPVAKPAGTTQYTVVVQNNAGCKDSATITISVAAAPKAEAGPDKNILEGQFVQLSSSDGGGSNSYSWSPAIFINDVHLLQPVVNPLTDITYFLTVTSNNGCGISKDSVRIHIFKKIIIPNAFSPNGDGINDTWNIKAITTYTDFNLSVFNRYGQLVFSSKDYNKPWDGSYRGNPLPIGTYYYFINLKQGLPLLKGYVVILR